jgi:hypothetical protein
VDNELAVVGAALVLAGLFARLGRGLGLPTIPFFIVAPERVLGHRVAARLRVRRDRPGALVALEDGRYAVTGALLITGSRDDVTTYARRRAKGTDPRRSRLVADRRGSSGDRHLRRGARTGPADSPWRLTALGRGRIVTRP